MGRADARGFLSTLGHRFQEIALEPQQSCPCAGTLGGNGDAAASTPPEHATRSGTFGDVEDSAQGAQPPGAWLSYQGNPSQADGGQPGSKRGDRWEVAVAYKGPCVLPWLWEDVTYGGEVLLKPQAIPFRAGPEGNTFKVLMLGAANLVD